MSRADGLRLSFPDGSWVLARPARTDPVVRVYAEAPDAAARDALIGAVCDSVAAGVFRQEDLSKKSIGN